MADLVCHVCIWFLVAALTAASETPRTELGLVPLVGGDTDIGVGFGFLGSLARVDPAVRPYRWRIESAGFFSFKKPDGGSLTAPYQDAFVMATIPGLMGGRARLELRPSFTRETNLRYYGLGNASVAPDEEVPARDFYERVHPTMAARGRFELGGGLAVLAGTMYVYNAVDFRPESTLAMDLASTDQNVRDLLLVDRRFGVHLVEAGLAFDRRDDEIAPARGQFHTVKVRLSPGGFDAQPYEYVQTTAVTRFYLPIVPGRLVLATRQVADALFGSPPFFELGRFGDDSSAIGGANGVRGVPADRYLGKVKVFGNLELRLLAARFSMWGSPYTLGVAGFIDGGRVWSKPEFDGTGLGLKWGTGGGVRLQKGSTFVIRADVAWSPDARPIGGYFLGGHLF